MPLEKGPDRFPEETNVNRHGCSAAKPVDGSFDICAP